MKFPGLWYLNERKLIFILYLSRSKFLKKGKMEWVPPRLVPHIEPPQAAGLPGLHRAASHHLRHLLLIGEVLTCAGQKGCRPKVEDNHVALQSHLHLQAGSSSPMFLQRGCFPRLISSILHPHLPEQEGKDQFCPIKLVLDKIWIISKAKQIGWALTLVSIAGYVSICLDLVGISKMIPGH